MSLEFLPGLTPSTTAINTFSMTTIIHGLVLICNTNAFTFSDLDYRKLKLSILYCMLLAK